MTADAEKSTSRVSGRRRTAKVFPKVQIRRTVAKSVTWRLVGTLDTFLISFVLITVLGPFLNRPVAPEAALAAASFIAATEVVTKTLLYFGHERFWARRHRTLLQGVGKSKGYGRTVAKTITWRTIATSDTVLIAWMFTGSFATALSIGGLEIFSKLVLYFCHERVWSRLKFGLAKPQEKLLAIKDVAVVYPALT